ncbi:11397_t:CDS:2, partial [Racocetra fulgida]
NNNAALLLQLLTNPSALQQTLATIIQIQQQSLSMPETTLPAKLKEAHEKSIPAPPKCKNITPPKNKKTSFSTRSSRTVLSFSNMINTTNNNNFQQSLSDENSSSTESSDKNSSSLINKQTTSPTLPNRGFQSAPPMNESDYLADDDNNDTQQSFNIIEDNNNNNNTQPFNAIEDNNNNQQDSDKKIIEVDNNNDIQQHS